MDKNTKIFTVNYIDRQRGEDAYILGSFTSIIEARKLMLTEFKKKVDVFHEANPDIIDFEIEDNSASLEDVFEFNIVPNMLNTKENEQSQKEIDNIINYIFAIE